MRGVIGRVINWYLKDGIGRLIGKLIGTVVTAVGVVDGIFGTHYLGLGLVIIVALLPTLIGSIPLITKGLDVLGVIELDSETETVRKGFGLLTGIDDWFELLTSWFFD